MTSLLALLAKSKSDTETISVELEETTRKVMQLEKKLAEAKTSVERAENDLLEANKRKTLLRSASEKYVASIKSSTERLKALQVRQKKAMQTVNPIRDPRVKDFLKDLPNPFSPH